MSSLLCLRHWSEKSDITASVRIRSCDATVRQTALSKGHQVIATLIALSNIVLTPSDDHQAIASNYETVKHGAAVLRV